MAYVRTDDGVEIYYETVGYGPPIVFVHGFGTSHAVWEHQVECLRDRYRCVTIDLRGHGESDKPENGYNRRRYTADVRAVIEALRLRRPGFVGWSIGVAVALEYVALYGCEFGKLVLAGGTPCWGRLPDFQHGHDQNDIDAWLEAIRADRLTWCGGFGRSLFHAPPPAHVQQWFFDQVARVPLHAVVKTIADSRHSDARPALANVTCPTRIFHGRHDALDYLAAGQYMQRHIRGARLVVFEASGHALHFEERARFNAELAAFFDAD